MQIILDAKEVAYFIASKAQWTVAPRIGTLHLDGIVAGRDELVRALQELLPSLQQKITNDEVVLIANREELSAFQGKLGGSRPR